MANQSRPDEDYVIAAVHVEAEARAILRSLSVTINMIAEGFLFNGWPSPTDSSSKITVWCWAIESLFPKGTGVEEKQYVRKCKVCSAALHQGRILGPNADWLCWNGRWILLPVHRGRLFKSFRQRTIIATATIELLREMFARYGNQQWNANRQRHFPAVLPKPRIYTPATYIPQSNGQTERSVDSFQRRLEKLSEGGRPSTLEHLQTLLSEPIAAQQELTPHDISSRNIPWQASDLLWIYWRNQFQLQPFKTNSSIIDMEQFIVNFSLMIRFTLRISQRKPEVNFNVNYNVLLVLGGRNRLIHTHINKIGPRTNASGDSSSWCPVACGDTHERIRNDQDTSINTKQFGGSGNSLVLLLIPMSTIPWWMF